MNNITSSEIAGLGVGTFLLCATIAAPKIDSFISSSQRVSLGMCKRCGDLKRTACKKCKGAGQTRDDSLFGFNLSTDPTTVRFSLCANCRGKGHFNCPDCAKSSAS